MIPQGVSLKRKYNYATVDSGEKGKIFELELEEGYIGFITHIGNDWYSDTYLELIIDDDHYVDSDRGRIEREIAPTNNPLELKPPILFKRKIICFAYNNSTEDHTFGLLIDGAKYPII